LLAALAVIALWMPPTSSSLGDEKHFPSLLLSSAARDQRVLDIGHADSRLVH
jgi:hypothetical protein